MAEIRTETVTYSFGDIIHDPAQRNRNFRLLSFIVSGIAVSFSPRTKSRKRQRTGLFEERVLGAGDFIGEVDFLLGQGADTWRLPLRCNSQEIVLHKLWLPNAIAPVHAAIPNLSPKAAAILFEALARALSMRMREVVFRLSQMAASTQLKMIQTRISKRRALVDATIKASFELSSVTENVYHMATAVVDTGKLKGRRGRLVLYPNHMAWSNITPRSGLIGHQSFLIPLDCVQDVVRAGAAIAIVVERDASDKGISVRPLVNQEPGCLFRNSIGKAFHDVFPGQRNNDVCFILSDKNSAMEMFRAIKSTQRTSKESSKPCFGMADPLNEGSDTIGSPDCSIDRAVSAQSGRSVASFDMLDLMEHVVTQALAIRLGMMFGYISPTEVLSTDDMEGLVQLFTQAKRLSFVDQETVINIASTNRRLLHITQGHVTIRSSAGKVIARVGAGKTLGELSFINIGNRGSGSWVVAESLVKVIMIDYDTVEMLALLTPNIGVRFCRSLAILSAE
eukprot:CAMPEP_0206234700 /NCGR_PEP_ID=MMETSP0047_2-20121206/12732_1 /ASSEMBLY_ACC=CAM_ASM_000192 /TAXON_ID=195065 /ORGANISM="Chroomonas mesostigmatica_cf, Strain CCMP1168" /LENGTH=506 /DNA_ID=CAMNT_0053658807 /DNA_START=148 /DNA_END=1665 /DNA_ORIENTATION=-